MTFDPDKLAREWLHRHTADSAQLEHRLPSLSALLRRVREEAMEDGFACVGRLLLRWEDKVENTDAAAIIHDCGFDLDTVRAAVIRARSKNG